VSSIGCMGGSYNGNRSFVFVEGGEMGAGFEWASICEEKVVVTVMRTEIDLGNLSGGFVLDWKPLQDCRTCERAPVGIVITTVQAIEDAKFLCFCKDGSISGERCKGGSVCGWRCPLEVTFGGIRGRLWAEEVAVFYCRKGSSKGNCNFLCTFD
jgi:hypothetical protein